MLNVIIVDDELWVCELIKRVVKWDELGFSIIGEAYDGNEALELIKARKPDLVITDIRMPGLDGISLIKNTKEAGLDTDFIIISGYSDFDYAKNALKFGALGYLLKPVDKRELTDLLNKVYENVFSRREKVFEERLVKGRLAQSLTQLKEQFFLNYLLSEGTEQNFSDMEKVNRDYEASFKQGCFQIVIFRIDVRKAEEPDSNVEKGVLERMYEIAVSQLRHGCYDIAVLRLKSQLACVLNYNPLKEFAVRNLISAAFEQMKGGIQLLNDYYLTAGLGSCETESDQLNRSFKKACNSIKARITRGVGKIIDTSGEVYGSVDLKEFFPVEQEMKLEHLLEVFDTKAAEKLATEFFGAFTDSRDAEPGLFFEIAYSIAETFFKAMHRVDIGIETEFITKSRVYREIEECSSIEGILKYFSTLFEGALSFYNNSKSSQNRKAIEVIKVYIREHYNEDISLNDAAGLVFLNASYLSELFKKETGINFSDYLINQRLEVAKELLKDIRYRTNEVAEMVGYRDAKYFSKLFKKVVGINPAEFRKMFS